MGRQTAGQVSDYSVYHTVPQRFGGDVEQALGLPPRLPIDAAALRRPVTRGLPPVMHPMLLPPEAARLPLLLPSAEEDVAEPGGGLFGVPAGMQEALAAAAAAGVKLPLAQRIDPVYPFLLVLALGIGSSYINLDLIGRYTILWTALLLLGAFLTLVDSPRTAGEMSSSGLGWGASFGLVFSLPLLILVNTGLSAIVGLLFPDTSLPVLFQFLVLLAPLAETLFLRGAMLERRGFAPAILGAGMLSLIMFWPAASGQPVYLVAVVVFMTVLAGMYGFVRSRYGLSAALVCQVCVNLMLMFIPGLLG